MPKILVTVNPDGTTKIDFEGYEGPSCMDADDKLRILLASQGIQIQQTSFLAKPELNQEAQSQTQGQHGEASS
jgi:hypothetical protein